MAKHNVKRRVVPGPKNLDEAAEYVRRIGEQKRNIEHLTRRLTEKIDRLKAVAVKNAAEYQGTIDELFEGLFVFAQGQRDALTDGGKRKTVGVPSGQFGWRTSPPAVSLTNVKAVIERLKAVKLERFLRVKEEVDKEAMLKEQEVAKSVEGVAITQTEEFFVKLEDMQAEVVSPVKKLKKVVDAESAA